MPLMWPPGKKVNKGGGRAAKEKGGANEPRQGCRFRSPRQCKGPPSFLFTAARQAGEGHGVGGDSHGDIGIGAMQGTRGRFRELGVRGIQQ